MRGERKRQRDREQERESFPKSQSIDVYFCLFVYFFSDWLLLLLLFIYLFYFTILYWFCHTLTWICHGLYMCSPSWTPSHLAPHPIPLGHPSAPAPSCIKLGLVIHFTYDNLHVSMPFTHISPQSPKDCSIHLCLFCCLTYRVIVTIFLNSKYMR